MTTIKNAKSKKLQFYIRTKKILKPCNLKLQVQLNMMLNDGIEKNGTGIWFADDNHLTIIVESDTTYGTFSIDESMLTLSYKR